jgi:hypothetical protein
VIGNISGKCAGKKCKGTGVVCDGFHTAGNVKLYSGSPYVGKLQMSIL